jgi:hypothetical protein
MKMTLKELKHLTQKQIRVSAVKEFPGTKIPKKWTDKKAALAWYDKTRKAGPTVAETKPKKIAVAKPKKEVKPKAKKEKEEAGPTAGKTRRERLVARLLVEQCTALELAQYENVQYKAILDDIHAIRHSRAGVDLLKGKVLIGTRVGRSKVFQICSEAKVESAEKKVIAEIEIVA